MILNTFSAYLSPSHLICKYFFCAWILLKSFLLGCLFLVLFSTTGNCSKIIKFGTNLYLFNTRRYIVCNSAGYYENQKPRIIYYKAERKIYCKTDRQTFDKLQWLKNGDSKGKQTEKAKLNKFPNKYCQDNAHPAATIWKMWTAWWITFCKWSHFYGPHWQSRLACCEKPGKVCQNLRYHISMIESMVFGSVRV